ncbi:MAG: DUF421 domain-containing protein [Pseudomonadota bacterium]|nr:DUF421 domain-containing protein [Pseudomonadota bacterium]
MELYDLWERALGVGLEAKDLSAAQMAARAALIYVVTLAFIRLAKKRFLAGASAFDVVVGIIIGSIASRTITGNAPLFPSMAAVAAIVAMHWLFSALAVRSHGFGKLIKGSSSLLVQAGQADEENLRRAHMSQRDLEEALRQQGVKDVQQVEEARLERDGSISVIER